MKVLGVFAHPDDEVIFGWPIFQDHSIDRHLMICVDDYEKYGSIKILAVREVCATEGITLDWVERSDGKHFKMIRRPEDPLFTIRKIDSLIIRISRIANEVNPDYVFTHNFWGDNGNSEHKFISEIVINHCLNYDILLTNRCEFNKAWLSYETIPRMHQRFFTAENMFKKCILDANFYTRCKAIYDKYKVWTGNTSVPPKYPEKESTLYCLERMNK